MPKSKQINVNLILRVSKKTAPDGPDRQTNRQTDRHGDSKTNSAQRGRVGEKPVSSEGNVKFQKLYVAGGSKKFPA